MPELLDPGSPDAIDRVPHPFHPHPDDDDQPPAPELPVVHPASAARLATTAVIAANCALTLITSWQSLRSPSGSTPADGWVWALGVLASLACFSRWLWQARANAQRISLAPHRLDARWIPWCWFVPGANLVVPPVLVSDVWRASHPDLPPGPRDLRAVRWGRCIAVAWASFLLAQVAVVFAPTPLWGHAVSTPLTLVCGAAAVYGMRRVDRWQTGREPVR
ncbi:DUF4328 domain-containing protein [Actinokineospora bangkokensis]|uniref:DUF4328 domain-containing protein n=1 Tax=Actinokineospora bangkokensis TaxID=1193682 RepID=A0A1Q9LFB1_9PSEU|nr:DUF4328 domain-containing protein [Actinokineospora bangkokensis]OLR90704.1 hypothetical protein BJP25_29345 [Actinokineospora bangkokensis]